MCRNNLSFEHVHTNRNNPPFKTVEHMHTYRNNLSFQNRGLSEASFVFTILTAESSVSVRSTVP